MCKREEGKENKKEIFLNNLTEGDNKGIYCFI